MSGVYISLFRRTLSFDPERIGTKLITCSLRTDVPDRSAS